MPEETGSASTSARDQLTAMSELERKEFNAFLSFFATFNLARPVTTVADLSDGAALFDVLALVYVPSHLSVPNSQRD
jgi:hypothetical protein